jgi:hypothetical protein
MIGSSASVGSSTSTAGGHIAADTTNDTGTEHVRVVVRLRPLNKNEIARGDTCSISVNHSDSPVSASVSHHQSQQVHVVVQKSANEYQQFNCSKCLPSSTDQPTFFAESGITSLLDAASAGYRCCAFAFGQTGAGKTFTMVSGANVIISRAPEDGIIGRSLEYLFHKYPAFEETVTPTDSRYTVTKTSINIRVSCIEIYHENVFDLFCHEKERTPLAIREHASEGFYLEGLKIVSCSTCAEAIKVINSALRYRQIGSHDMNSRSSRSHCITDIYVDKVVTTSVSSVGADEAMLHSRSNAASATPTEPQTDPDSGRAVSVRPVKTTAAPDSLGVHRASEILTKSCGKISLVDLAGSERLKSTASTGKVLQEAGFINKSLYVLGKVIAGLVRTQGERNNKDVPYRDSKLTKILIASLGGNCKTMLIACVTESSGSVQETMRTLKFSMSCARIKNIPVIMKQDQAQIVAELRDQIYRLKQENRKLKISLDFKSVATNSSLVPIRTEAGGPSRIFKDPAVLNGESSSFQPRIGARAANHPVPENNKYRNPKDRRLGSKGVNMQPQKRRYGHKLYASSADEAVVDDEDDMDSFLKSLTFDSHDLSQGSLVVQGQITGQPRTHRSPKRSVTHQKMAVGKSPSAVSVGVGSGLSAARKRLHVNELLKGTANENFDVTPFVGDAATDSSTDNVTIISARAYIQSIDDSQESDTNIPSNDNNMNPLRVSADNATSLRREQQRLRILEQKAAKQSQQQREQPQSLRSSVSDSVISMDGQAPQPKIDKGKIKTRAQMTKLEMMQEKMRKLETSEDHGTLAGQATVSSSKPQKKEIASGSKSVQPTAHAPKNKMKSASPYISKCWPLVYFVSGLPFCVILRSLTIS